MTTLAIECSTGVATIGLVAKGQLLSERRSLDYRQHSEFVNVAFAECLSEAQIPVSRIEKIAVGIGPGSFTGIRVAVNMARSLAMVLHRPVCGVTTMQTLAFQGREKEPGKNSLILLNAFKNQVFVGLSSQPSTLRTPLCLNLPGLAQFLNENVEPGTTLLALGEGHREFQSALNMEVLPLTRVKISTSSGVPANPTALGLVGFAESVKDAWTEDWKSLIPLYIRPSAAEENFRQP